MLESHGIKLIAAERQRQIEKHGFDAKHDDSHTDGELVEAAICYAFGHQPEGPYGDHSWGGTGTLWPFEQRWFQVEDTETMLAKAGAFIVAELDRLNRLKDSINTH